MSADRVREIVLVRAFEESDPEGLLLPMVARSRASKEARDSAAEGDGASLIATRAAGLSRTLHQKFGVLEALRRGAPQATALGPWLCLVALVFGVSLNALGPQKEINVLSFPLLFVIVWNLVVYLVLILDRFRGPRPASRWRTPLGSAFAWLAAPERPWRSVSAGFQHEQAVGNALQRFPAGWWRVGQSLHRARIERGFHASSALVAVGTVLGMSVRGLALSYQLTWESTFLGRDAVQSLVSTVLWPADQVLGLGTTLGAAGEASPAAPWIHLYAMTAVLFVIAPRLCLFFVATRRAKRLEQRFELNMTEGYFLRLLASDRGQGVHASVHSYSYSPSKLAADGLQALLLDIFGNRARLEMRGALEYGTEWGDAGAPGTPNEPDCIVLIFNAAQSPEQEVHGHFLEGARAALDRGNTAARVLVLVDESRYRDRLGSGEDGERRILERQRAWERLVREAGLRSAFVSLAEPAKADDLERIRGAVQGSREALVG